MISRPSPPQKIMPKEQMLEYMAHLNPVLDDIGWQKYYLIKFENHPIFRNDDAGNVADFRIDAFGNVDHISFLPFISYDEYRKVKMTDILYDYELLDCQKWLLDKKWAPLIQRSKRTDKENNDYTILSFRYDLQGNKNHLDLLAEMITNVLMNLRDLEVLYDLEKFQEALM